MVVVGNAQNSMSLLVTSVESALPTLQILFASPVLMTGSKTATNNQAGHLTQALMVDG
jgi:hypothetical protein